MEKKYAILVVDMLNDFVTGALKCDRGLAIVPKTAELLNGAREKNIPVIFCNDAHLKGIDHELKLWGDHAIAGTEGAKVIPELDSARATMSFPRDATAVSSTPTLTFSSESSESTPLLLPDCTPICAFATPPPTLISSATTLLLSKTQRTPSPPRTMSTV